MAEARQCEYLLLRYVPDVTRGEFLNIGVMLREQNGAGYQDVRMQEKWDRVLAFDPTADEELLKAMERDLRVWIRVPQDDRYDMVKAARETSSNTLQVSEMRALLTASPEAEMERLVERYLMPRPITRDRKESARTALKKQMKEAFVREGLWDVMAKDIPAARFTRRGDPLKIDCGYRNGVFQMYHAVPVESDADAAKLLAFTYPRLREGVRRELQIEARLTAVVEDKYDRDLEQAAFAVATMQEVGIGVVEVGSL